MVFQFTKSSICIVLQHFVIWDCVEDIYLHVYLCNILLNYKDYKDYRVTVSRSDNNDKSDDNEMDSTQL